MTHPAITDQAAATLKASLKGEPAPVPAAALVPAAPPAPQPGDGKWSAATLKARARQAATPIIDKVRHELATAAEQEQAELRAEVAELKDLIVRTRSEHAAELAALHEELAAVRRP
jgi:hypothetical protein